MPFRFGKFFGNTVGNAAGFAAGVAVAPTLRPGLQEVENQAWAHAPTRRLDAEVAAAIVAEDVDRYQWGEDEAGDTGVDPTRFKNLLGEALNAPGLAELFEAWRRDLINDAAFEHGLRKAKLEPRWDAPLKALKARLLGLSDLANARQQGFIDDARQHSESALQGLDPGRADIMFELSGLPLGVETMQQALNRGLVDRPTFDQAVREGHTKTKYTDLAESLRHPVLGARDYAELHLRQWITEAEMNAGGALTGYTPEQMNLLYLNRGRPATGHQILIGLRRGGKVGGSLAGIPQDFVDAVARSNIRPEYTNPLWYGATSYPSGFMIRGATQAGDITGDEAKQLLFESGWSEKWIDVFVASWTKPSATKADTHEAKAQVQLWTTLHSAYLAGDAIDAAVTAKLPQAGVDAATVPKVLATWKHEREIVRQRLTATQVKKAYTKAVRNPATGVPWTRDDALAELLSRGWSAQDANTFLDE